MVLKQARVISATKLDSRSVTYIAKARDGKMHTFLASPGEFALDDRITLQIIRDNVQKANHVSSYQREKNYKRGG